MFFDPDGRLSQSFINNLWNSASGTTWNNNNDGSFSNNWGDTMSNDGIGMNFNSSTGFYGGRGGGGAYSSGGGYIDIPGITLTGKSSGWGSQIQNQFNAMMGQFNTDNAKAFTDWYIPSGQANWAFGAAATFSSIKGGLNAERMYGEGIRRGISANYALTGSNLSRFGKMASTKASMPVSSLAKWGGLAGKASFGAAIIMNEIAVSNGIITREKANLDATMGAYGLTGAGTIPSLLYFGVDVFYPGGWAGYGNDYESLQKENSAIVPGFITAPYGSQKF